MEVDTKANLERVAKGEKRKNSGRKKLNKKKQSQNQIRKMNENSGKEK